MTTNDESGLRGGLRELAERDPTGPLQVAELLGRARRRRKRFVGYRAAGVAGTALCAAGAVFAAGAMWSGSSTTTGSAGSLAPQTCVSTWNDSASLPTPNPGVAKALLPGNPQAGLACLYSAGRLVDSVPLLGDRFDAVVAALHKPVKVYSFRCPAAVGKSGVVLEFRSEDEPDVFISMSAQCPGLSNGALTQVAFNSAGTLPAVLAELLPKAQQ